MNLYLQHSIQSKPATAVFIRGNDPLVWLKEIDRWKQPIGELECYVIPQSIQSPEAAGLFVIFKQPSAFASIELADAYCSIADKLFIPVNADVLPHVNNDEWKSLLIWHRQVLHPVIGLVGFEINDRIDPGNLLQPSQSINMDWSFANPGLDEKPLLNRIKVLPPDPNEMVESMKKELDNKPLGSILNDKEGENRTIIDKVKDGIKLYTLKPLRWLTRGILKILPPKEGDQDGVLNRAEKWLNKKIDDLEKRREDEINRLRRLFDEDIDEALKYAVPLDSPYLSRGQSGNDNSYKLGERRPLFNLGGLGGGGTGGSWMVADDHYNDLRSKYHRAAQKAIEEKDYRKAAYIYAHLLSDFNAAANVLQQGGYYREAAALYREHLKNENAAAECLEKGGLYLEAIDAYKNLNKNEKVGDLYTRLQRNDDAGIYYEKHIDASIDRSDYLDAARVINEKMKQQDRAKETLLTGWKQSANGES
ncbi:MAG TPA: hypothetical protein VHM26_15950, partial [Chitinophagaceae bacterium]|nr:hypothetical protein [Chitinophagaceae bacterium]